MANTGYEKLERRERPWSDLPTELMELIVKRCNFSGQARLRAVCRRWQSIPPVQPIKRLPWLMAYDDRKWSRCKLFDLTYNTNYTVSISTMKEYYKEKNPRQIRICASKSGWLLLSHSIPLISNEAFFLYSPYTNRMIQLPNLKTSHYWVTATFSADPTSADCVFFALQHSSDANTIGASTCRLGDTKWTTHVFRRSFKAITDVVYSQGLLWCANRDGRLATFCVAQGIWNKLQSPAPVLPFDHMQDRIYLVESNGNLLLVLISLSQKDKSRLVYKLDRLQMAWISVEDVGDQILFLDPTSFLVSKLGEGVKIHYSWRYYRKYLCKNRKRIYTNPKRYGSLTGKIWIEPPSLL